MQDDGQAGEPSGPWFADAINPVENLRALADVHAFGRQAVEDLADRIQAWGGGAGQATADGAQNGTGPAVADVVEQLRGDAVLAGEGLARLAEHTVTLLGVPTTGCRAGRGARASDESDASTFCGTRACNSS